MTVLFFITGCQTANEDQTTVQSRNNYYNLQTDANNRTTNGDRANNMYGYSRYQKAQVDQEGIQKANSLVNRQRLSDGVTRLTLSNDDVEEAATLVTDEHVLVAYTTKSANRDYVADKVKRSAISVVPRFYDVYISDDHRMFQAIERFQGLQSTNGAIENTMEQTIERFKHSPQGEYNEDTDSNMNIMRQKHQKLKRLNE